MPVPGAGNPNAGNAGSTGSDSGSTGGGGYGGSGGGTGNRDLLNNVTDETAKKKKRTFSSDPASNVPSVSSGQPGSVPTTSPTPTPDEVDLSAPEEVPTTPTDTSVPQDQVQDDNTVAKKAKQQAGIAYPASSAITGASGIFLP
jgi:hypothetical protein